MCNKAVVGKYLPSYAQTKDHLI